MPAMLSSKQVPLTQKMGADAGFTVVTNQYDEQDRVMKILAYRVMDGGLQKARAQRSFANEKGGLVQVLKDTIHEAVATAGKAIVEPKMAALQR